MACGGGDSTEPAPAGAKYGGTLRAATADELLSMDPGFGTGGAMNSLGFLVYNNIVGLGTEGEILPELATDWEISDDGRALTFDLRGGVKFHDGSDFNAEAVKWNADRILDPAVGSGVSSRFEGVARVVANDSDTVTFHLKEPFRPFLSFLTELPGMVLSPTAVEKYGGYSDRQSEWGRNPVGTGAFTWTEWTVGNRVIVTKNEDYWDSERPFLDAVELRFIADDTVRLSMVRTSETDVIEGIGEDDLQLLETNPDVKVHGAVGGRTHVLWSRVSEEPWSNNNVLQAIASAIDRQTYLNTIHDGIGRPAYTMTSTGWAHNPNLRPLKFDLAVARQKMADAGYANGLSMSIWTNPTPSDIEKVEVIQSMVGEIGIDLGIEQVAPGEAWKNAVEGNTHHGIFRWRPTADPHLNLVNIFGSNGGQNKWDYSNPEVDRLLTQAAQEYDVARAKPLYDNIQTIIAQDAPFIYLIWAEEFTVLNTRIQNFARTPDLDLRYRDLWIEE
jgi:peptide/nickel transport system substrate-binding protein